MKFELEEYDIEGIKFVLETYCDIYPNNIFIKNMAARDQRLPEKMEQCEEFLDNLWGLFADLLIEELLDGVQPPDFYQDWTWPVEGDSEEYKSKFNKAIKLAAKQKGVVLGEAWNEEGKQK